MMSVPSEAIERFQEFFEELTEANVDGFRDIATSGVHYKDPFIDSQGIDAVVASMRKWFHDMDGIKFQMTDYAANGPIVFQYWKMTFRLKKLPKRLWNLDGVSKVTYDSAGLVIDQVDYWDASPLYESIPVLGAALKIIRMLFA